ncbi:MAG: T9SS type A sorting domain-containing protein [Flavobacteriales bacterium]
MKHPVQVLVLCGLLLPWGGAIAQPIVDIGLYDSGSGQIEVRLRPDGPFDGLASSIVFTVRWNDSDGATLGAVSQPSPISVYLPVGKSGPMQISGGYRYQVFSGISLVTLLDAETAWVGGDEVVVCQVNVVGSSLFEIVNDAWTTDVNHNGDYYISLNGENRTGEIYTISTGMVQGEVDALGIDVQPNPTDGLAQLAVTVPDATPLTVELFDPSGRMIMRNSRPEIMGAHREVVDMGAFADGIYLLKVQVGERISTQRLVVDRH